MRYATNPTFTHEELALLPIPVVGDVGEDLTPAAWPMLAPRWLAPS